MKEALSGVNDAIELASEGLCEASASGGVLLMDNRVAHPISQVTRDRFFLRFFHRDPSLNQLSSNVISWVFLKSYGRDVCSCFVTLLAAGIGEHLAGWLFPVQLATNRQ